MIELEYISFDHLGLQVQQRHPFVWLHNHELITASPLEKTGDPSVVAISEFVVSICRRTMLRTAVMNFSHDVLHCRVTWDMPWDPGVMAIFFAASDYGYQTIFLFRPSVSWSLWHGGRQIRAGSASKL
jgi:hypothetical protein